MTNREFLQRRVRYWAVPVVPIFVCGAWVRHFGSHPGHVDYVRDDWALLTGGMVLAALSYLQWRILRARFRCPRCNVSLWSQKGYLESTDFRCPACDVDMNSPHPDQGNRLIGKFFE